MINPQYSYALSLKHGKQAILDHLAGLTGPLVRQALSVGYADAMGYAMFAAGLFVCIGCWAAFSGLDVTFQ